MLHSYLLVNKQGKSFQFRIQPKEGVAWRVLHRHQLQQHCKLLDHTRFCLPGCFCYGSKWRSCGRTELICEPGDIWFECLHEHICIILSAGNTFFYILNSRLVTPYTRLGALCHESSCLTWMSPALHAPEKFCCSPLSNRKCHLICQIFQNRTVF